MAGQQYAHEDYTVGWICALPKTELVAAAAMLDEEYLILPATDPQDANTYLLGRIGDHNVVIACLPAEMTGKVSAATVATDMIRSFPSIRFGLMVGIGGGAPRRAYPEQGTGGGLVEDDFDESEDEMEEIPDIRLGDVVVCLHTKSAEAVVQYDFGKSLQEKEFVHTGGKLNKPPRIVLNAVGRLQANHIRGHRKIPELLSKMLTENSDMIHFQHPGLEKDRLFRPDVVHVEGRKSCRDCCGLNNANIVKRDSRSDTVPKIHYGTIGSADQVMKDAILRDQWALKENILCFEMEAAGLMDSFPCLVIRGICDYADSHKNKVWQPYAAATAAAYAKELLLVIPGQGLMKLSPIKQLLHLSEQIEAVNSTLEKTFEQRENHHHDQIMRYATEDQRRCHQVFKTSTYEKFKNINPNRVEGTCEWVLKSPEYLRWWNATHNDLLWISADPGCGKSVLAKSLIDEVFALSDLNVLIVYFFFKDNDEQNNLATALCAVLHQLFSLQPQLLRHALPFWERSKEKIQYEVDDMWRIFMATMSDGTFGNTICVFDALDECRDHDQKQLIERLHDFHNRRPASQENWLKFLVTSRPYDDIQDRFRPLTECFPQIHLRGEEENDQIHEEINLVVKVKLTELGKDLGLRANTQERLERELYEMKHRTYLWLYLAIDDIKRTLKNSLRPDRETIPPLPKNVSKAYERILDRVPSDQKTKVETILRIIIGARRPLTVQEMAMALGTAREFLISKHGRSPNVHWHLEQRKTEIQMTEICVKYLVMNDLVSNDGESIRSLLDYSAENWADHFRDVLSPEAELVDWVWKLYDVMTKRFRLWFPKFWTVAMRHRQDPKMKALHLAAFNGHPDILCRVDVNKTDAVDQFDRSGTTALQWACERGHLEIAQLLLEKGADVNAQGGYYGNALNAAAEGGYLEIVQLLLEKEADVNTQRVEHSNALQAAARGGYLEIVQLLLEKGADVNAQGGYYGNALNAAARGGYLEIFQLLLEKGADVNTHGIEHGDALQAAARGGYLEIVQLLLEKGADVNAQGGYHGNALNAAAKGGYLKIVQLLLAKGADVNIQGGNYGNALYAAAQKGHLEIIQLLLEGADVNAQGGYYGNALNAAAGRGYLETFQLLLEKGADINAQGGYYGNALNAAARGGYLEIVQLLLEKGADAKTHGGEYGNALQAAARGG
ncbi:ankyrin repeat-containing protein, putative [Talaromyces stipitatus ATCC 10500]|uniref:Ankyrin repeat-containing protein, putative n=1 Tax=Talaromyces stipitatus (strain ATCC 10500 / CBS 375.48 / QM 6759 / NRRL 1006) TaxID=441959 RepID=B8MSF5_TALSN|nr:ankyrin repeat-containing protein, putative [Talaromyces stipitatus ATCC 10500]EED11950.1 ankyrin repeat-containing protein, putative [Talaromyces stipitatus ATCC 10500]